MRALLLIGVAGCGRIYFSPLGSDAGGVGDGPVVAPCVTYSAWATPVEASALRTAAGDWEPALHPAGDLLVFSRAFDGLYSAQRSGSTFVNPTRLDVFTGEDFGPAWSHTGDTLYFVTDRNAPANEYHLWYSEYAQGSFSPPQPVVELASEPVVAPTVSGDGLELYYGSFDTGGIHRAERSTPTSPWVVTGLESQIAVADASVGWPSISQDGLTLYFEAIAGAALIYQATRPSTSERFGNVTLVLGLNSADDEVGDPEISRDGTMLVFARKPNGSPDEFDVYVSTRTCLD